MKSLLSLLCVAILSFASNVFAQSVTIGTVPGFAFCTGEDVMIPYTATGTFTNNNSFIVQISDHTGSFETKFHNAGTIRASTSGLIKATIPTDIQPSLKYRFRIVSSDPFIISSNDNGKDIGLGPVPNTYVHHDDYPLFKDHHFFFALLGDTIEFTAPSQNENAQWDFGPGAIPQFSLEKTVKVVFTRVGFQTIQFTGFSVGGCSKTEGNAGLDNFYIGSCFPAIPSDAQIDSADTPDQEARVMWVVPGGQISGLRNGQFVFAEAGATVDRSEADVIHYMKAGSGLNDNWTGYIVYEKGAAIDRSERANVFECDNLEFDYSNAPPYRLGEASVQRKGSAFMQVQPNPATDRLFIDHKGVNVREFVLRNSIGAQVLYSKPTGDRTRLDLTQLAAGLYFLDVLSDRGIETQKIVVRK